MLAKTLWTVLPLAAVACGHPAPPPALPVTNRPPPVAPAPPAAPDSALLAWPVAPLTAAQRAEARGCDIDKLAAARYPDKLTPDALAAAFAAHTGCDQAVLAATCAKRAGDADPPASCLEAYRAAVRANAGYVFVANLPAGYFGKVRLVAPPPAAAKPVTDLVVAYSWSGLGTEVTWTLAVHDAASAPRVELTGTSASGHAVPSSAQGARLAAAFGAALDSFLPIAKPLEAVDCTDNYPDWTATVTFQGGGKLELATHRSNLIGMGGPWQMTLDGVTYLQMSPGLTHAIAQALKELALPLGEPEGMTCQGFDLAGAVLGPTT